ncbi:ricin-type beta-trefoil lectin domain protein [Streptomyces sp. NRRL S-481]|uniref:ricin-type beta-trefoil lectin domain protein n=1 Tax=Streptomyces sp. NRRL S-481 TaxID=1463911 RepID=UPI0004C70177|nr:ricin-type beta-trefoil lectin domain protein [Streptomyces sp. NRRL S-481]
MPNSQHTRPSPHSAVLPPARTRFLRRALACLAAALIAAPITVLSTGSPAAAETNPTDASKFQGVNWARIHDNFVNGPLYLEGLAETDDYDTVKAKANAILGGFQSTLGANTVRLPINRYSVPGTTWGDKYTGAIDAATAKGFKVILSYWDGDGVGSNGHIVDAAAFTSMWKAVTDKYGSNGLVYFEPYNEPKGYTATEWANVAANWIASNPTIPKNRIIVSGHGDNQWVTSVCADSRLDGTYLSLHHYTFYSGPKTYDGWVSDFKSKVGTCGTRTILDEFGAPMDKGTMDSVVHEAGKDYNDAASTDNFVQYLRADTDSVRSLGMGAVYWPALGGKRVNHKDYDWYSLFDLKGSGTNLALGVRNISGIDRLKYAWGRDPGSHTSMLRNVGSNGCLDHPLGQNNVQVQVYAQCWGGDNQQWTRTPSGQLTVYSGTNKKCLDAWGTIKNGTVVGTYNCNGQDNQKWRFYSDGTIRPIVNLDFCLDRNGDSKVQLWSCWGGNNQKWQTS